MQLVDETYGCISCAKVGRKMANWWCVISSTWKIDGFDQFCKYRFYARNADGMRKRWILRELEGGKTAICRILAACTALAFFFCYHTSCWMRWYALWLNYVRLDKRHKRLNMHYQYAKLIRVGNYNFYYIESIRERRDRLFLAGLGRQIDF